MKGLPYIIILGMLLPACSTLHDTASAWDDVYDIPDRTAMASVRAAAADESMAPRESGDYYDPAESRRAGTDRDYYDLTYNDPYYYNYGRFGFGTGIGTFGPSYGMGLSYGWPTSFGSMHLYYGTGYGMYGYNPYWANSWMSGYGYWPSYYSYDPFGYYGYGRYGPGWGGYGMGYGPYYGPWGTCYGCYEPISFGGTSYAHRPSMSTGQAGSTAIHAPRLGRNPVGLMPDAPSNRGVGQGTPAGATRPSRTTAPSMPSKGNGMDRTPATRPGTRPAAPSTRPSRDNTRPDTRPSRNFDFNSTSPSRSSGGSFGGNGGGSRTTSPRPGR